MTLNEFLSKVKGLFASVEKIEANIATTSELLKENASLKEQITQKENVITEENATIAGLKSQVAEKEAALVAKEAEHKKALEAKDKEVDGKASRKAGIIVEQTGVPPVTGEKTEAQEASAEDVKTKFASMKPGKERSEFYRKHKSILQ